MFFFSVGGKETGESREEAPEQGEDQKQTQSARVRESNRATLVGGNCSRHCAIRAPRIYIPVYFCNTLFRAFSVNVMYVYYI